MPGPRSVLPTRGHDAESTGFDPTLQPDVGPATHNMQQTSGCSDSTSFFYLGKMVEFASTETLFTTPAKQGNEDYVSGRFG